MSSIRKGASRNKSTAARGGGGTKKSSSKAQWRCFAACGQSTPSAEQLAQHYEKVFGYNEPTHVQALADKLDPNFSIPTSCQICGAPFKHSGLLLQHVFTAATATKSSSTSAVAQHEREMHASLFQRFVQELISMPVVGKEEAVEYMLSLVVPDLSDEEEEDEEDGEDEDDEENDLYEDDEDEAAEVSLEELAEFEAFLAASGLDLDDVAGPGFGGSPFGGAGGKAKGKAKGKGKGMGFDMDMDMGMGDGFGGPRGKMEFMKQFMKMSMGAEDSEEEEEEEEEDLPPRKHRKSKAKAKDESTAASASAVPPVVPAGSNQPGDVQCAICGQLRGKDLYSAVQLKKKGKRKCKCCVEMESGMAGPACAAAAAAVAGASSAAQPSPPSAASSASSPFSPSASTAASPSSPTAATAAAASAVAPSSPTPSASISSSPSSTSLPPRTSHSLHCHHLPSAHRLANGEEIQSEPEEFDGDGEQQSTSMEEEEEEDSEDDSEKENDSEEDDDDDLDPFSALFGGGRRSRRSGPQTRRGTKRPRPTAKSMNMHIVIERPGQLLTRDRRLHLKPSSSYPIRCWLPRAADGLKCFECEWRMPSRLVQGWKLTCLHCAIAQEWIPDEEAANSEEEEQEGGAQCRSYKLSLSPSVSFHASTFPNYRSGIPRCVRPQCQSDRLLLVYDAHKDEWVVCTDCGACKQKIRSFDSVAQRLVDAVQEPLTQD